MFGKLGIAAGISLSGLIVAALVAASCTSNSDIPAPAPSVVQQEDDDSCWSIEELVERDEDCGYDKKSPTPKATKTTAPAKPPTTVKPRSTRR